MAPQVTQLPCELEEEILSRLPPQSLVRFRTVCKQWNSLFNDKSFINNHLSHSRPQFIILINSKIYSIDVINHDINSIDPTIELRELLTSSVIPYHDTNSIYPIITTCDELLYINYGFWMNKTALWNPWLSQVKWIDYKDRFFYFFGLGYDNSRPEKVYKILGYLNFHPSFYKRVVIYECASNALKFIYTPEEDCHLTSTVRRSYVSLKGNLYWVTRNLKTHEYFIQSFDFSTEIFKPFCLLPCQKNRTVDQLVLAVHKGDRFSLLNQCFGKRKIEIWVTKNIDREGKEVVWVNLMTLPTTNLLFWQFYCISYFIYDKTLFMCCCEPGTAVACIYIVREDLCKKIQIDSGIVNCCHCVYTPNFISVPLLRGEIE